MHQVFRLVIVLLVVLVCLSADVSAQRRRGRRRRLFRRRPVTKPARPTRPFRRARRTRRESPPGRTISANSEELGRITCSLDTTRLPQSFPTADGTCNNLQSAQTILNGATGEIYPRLTPSNFSDDRSELVTGRPDPRTITNAIVAQSRSIPSRTGSQLLPFFGQFIDHDLDLTGMSRSERVDIPVLNEEDLDRFGGDIQFFRSEPAQPRSNDPLEFRNEITSYLDLSSIYGSDPERTRALRTNRNGLLRTRGRGSTEVLPLNRRVRIEMDQNNRNTLAAGDARANEHLVLISLTTLFVREHNRLARQFRRRNRRASDEEIFQNARIRNIAQYQSIIYTEFLPSLLGNQIVNRVIGRDQGFDPNVDPEISLEFSTAAFRWGHSAVPDEIQFINARGRVVRESRIRDLFFRPEIFEQRRGLLDAALIGITRNPHEDIDVKVVDSLRQDLFNNLDIGPLDLISLNIQRGRDHGIGNINDLRRSVNLSPIQCPNNPARCFQILTGENVLSQQLANLYGDLNSCDLWICGLAERDAPGSQMGETFSTVLATQFKKLRDGDRFYFERNPTLSRQLGLPLKMSDIYRRNIRRFRDRRGNLFRTN